MLSDMEYVYMSMENTLTWCKMKWSTLITYLWTEFRLQPVMLSRIHTYPVLDWNQAKTCWGNFLLIVHTLQESCCQILLLPNKKRKEIWNKKIINFLVNVREFLILVSFHRMMHFLFKADSSLHNSFFFLVLNPLSSLSSNFILLWEWMWCHHVLYVKQDWNAGAVDRSRENTRATTNKTQLKCLRACTDDITSILKVG